MGSTIKIRLQLDCEKEPGNSDLKCPLMKAIMTNYIIFMTYTLESFEFTPVRFHLIKHCFPINEI